MNTKINNHNRFDNLSFNKKFVIIFAFPIILTTFIVFIFSERINTMNETAMWVSHTEEVIKEINNLVKLVVDMETGVRGYLITGKDNFLEPYISAKNKWEIAIVSLSDLVSDNPIQVDRISQISILHKKWLSDAAEIVIAARITAQNDYDNNDSATKILNINQVVELTEKETGKTIIDKMRVIVDEFVAMENQLMLERERESERTLSGTYYILIFGIAIYVFISIFFGIMITKKINSRLNSLYKSTLRIASGKLESEVNCGENDEIGKLATSFENMRITLKAKIGELEQTSKAKSEFVANMSHEIRTPMNGVLSMISMLELSDIDEQQKEYLHILKSSGEGLLVIINDILDYSKLQEGKLELESISFSLRDTITDSAFLLNFLASQSGVILSHRIPDDLPEFYLGDANRIKQVILNLVNNAIKFSQGGTVELSVSFKPLENDIYSIRFTIKDNGIGIAAEDQKKLFKSFSQVDPSITRQYGGTGLGLAICSQLTQLMKGKIWFDSMKGSGSAFYVQIPLQVSHQQKKKQAVNSIVESFKDSSHPMSILVVEDNIVNQRIAMLMFKRLGLNPDLAVNGQDALDKCENTQYDLIFMDMQMPVMDGVTATKKLVQLYGKDQHKIIAMSANVLPEDKNKCIAAGMIDFLDKPFNMNNLIQVINNNLD